MFPPRRRSTVPSLQQTQSRPLHIDASSFVRPGRCCAGARSEAHRLAQRERNIANNRGLLLGSPWGSWGECAMAGAPSNDASSGADKTAKSRAAKLREMVKAEVDAIAARR